MRNFITFGIQIPSMKHCLFLLVLFSSAAFAQPGFSAAESLYRQGNYEGAKTQFEQYLKTHPNHLASIEYLGDIEGHQKRWEHAISYYSQLKKLRPSEATYHYKYGGVLGMHAKASNKFKALGMIGDIRKSFEKAIALDPKHIEARWALIELYLQLPGIAGGSESKAQMYAAELLGLSPVDGYLAKGRIAEYFDRFPTAEKYYKLAVATGGSRTTYQKLADLYKNKMNQPDKARATWAEFNEKKKS